jgi:hypothetical protein
MPSLRKLKRRPSRDPEDVLRYSPTKASRSVVRRAYAVWRERAGIPRRCDFEDCQYHAAPLRWRGAVLPLILDHIDGIPFNNSPKNLRYLCPNCDSQLTTRGGRNRGRQDKLETGGYSRFNDAGVREFRLMAEVGTAKAVGLPAQIKSG